MSRVYLDHNATMPLRAEARAAMLAAMDLVGNPSSVHAEGRAAKMLIEKSRAQVADLVGCQPQEIVFTGGASEAAALALRGRKVACANIEHDAIRAHQTCEIPVDQNGFVTELGSEECDVVALQAANSETGILQNNIEISEQARAQGSQVFVDTVQQAGKFGFDFEGLGADYMLLSAHKFGGPKGVGALCVRGGLDVEALVLGGGQELGRRSGTENVVGIAGFGAAAVAAKQDLEAGAWGPIYELRNILESTLEARTKETIFVGNECPRLPNTSCILTPGWKGETQVMQMDLAGFAISAGSACSSGKVKASRVLQSMGFSEQDAGCAIRVSLGLDTTEDDVMRFAKAWCDALDKRLNTRRMAS